MLKMGPINKSSNNFAALAKNQFTITNKLSKCCKKIKMLKKINSISEAS
jgi:hypothetical protein